MFLTNARFACIKGDFSLDRDKLDDFAIDGAHGDGWRFRRGSFEPVMTFTRRVLVLGDTVLAPLRSEPDAAPEIAIAGAEERILALLAVAYGKAVQPAVLGRLHGAARYWRRSEPDLAAIEIALSGLPPLDRERAAARLHLGETLLAEALGPRQLIELCGLDPNVLDMRKAGYNPDEPRVPAGNPAGGQWTTGIDDISPVEALGPSTQPDSLPSSAGGDTSAPSVTRVDPNPEVAAYTVVHGLPSDAIIVTTPGGRTIADPESTTKKLMAPGDADFQKVYAAGRAISGIPLPSQIPVIRLALAHGGTYDFQGNPATGHFYPDYTNASNYAVGVYMAGAGYSLSSTEIFAELYAFLYSSNYESAKAMKWIAHGWVDAAANFGPHRHRDLEMAGKAHLEAGDFISLAVDGLYTLRFILFIVFMANLLYQRDLEDASAKNARGDVASAETNFFGAPERRVTTVIRLKRAGHWFSTTLVNARTWAVLVGLKWRDDDTLVLRLDFGCEPQMDSPVTEVGPIHIVYHWGDPGYDPKNGYETFRRRDLPPEPCPAIGAEPVPRVAEPPLLPTP